MLYLEHSILFVLGATINPCLGAILHGSMNRVVILGIIATVTLAVVAVWQRVSTDNGAQQQSSNPTITQLKSPGSSLDALPRQSATLAQTDLRLYVATNPEQTTKGLSDTAELPDGHGMLFYIPNRHQLRFWMKDMHYPIDMLWLDHDRRVIHIESNVSPDTYPRQFANPSGTDAHYVLELNSGDASRHNVNLGDQLHYTGGVLDYLPT